MSNTLAKEVLQIEAEGISSVIDQIGPEFVPEMGFVL